MMYLLLRNNKQSGPYSLDDLKTMGLKAYDLVWVDGKSAAWRYPCEIDELSAFAPAVEEQPFDRFFKKASPVQANNNSSVISNNSFGNNSFGDPPKHVNEPMFEAPKGEPSSVPGKRIIYVTMPASAPIPASYKSEPTPVEFNLRTILLIGNGKKLLLWNSCPGLKDAGRTVIFKPLIIGMALLAAGIFIGLSINKDYHFRSSKRQDRVPPMTPGHPTTDR